MSAADSGKVGATYPEHLHITDPEATYFMKSWPRKDKALRGSISSERAVLVSDIMK